jgi:hypothetical protein
MGVGAIATYLLADEAEHYRVRSLLDRRKRKSSGCSTGDASRLSILKVLFDPSQSGIGCILEANRESGQVHLVGLMKGGTAHKSQELDEGDEVLQVLHHFLFGSIAVVLISFM